MAGQWRCAVVGTGSIGDAHVRTVAQLPCATLAAVCDVSSSRAKAALEKYQLTSVPIYEDLSRMLKQEQIDVVHICTPSGMHMDQALLAMQTSRNVICEKPLDVTLEKVDRMIQGADEHKVRLAGIFQNRWNDANLAIKQAVQQGRFGRISWAGCFTLWYRPDKYYQDVNWRGTWGMDGGGAIMNQSIHAIDLLQWIAGDVDVVSAQGGRVIHAGIETEDTLSCSLRFKSGAFGTIVGTTAMFPGAPPRLEIGGENGAAISEGGLKVFKFRDESPDDQLLLEKLRTIQTKSAPGPICKDSPLDLHGKNILHILQSWEAGQDAQTSGPEARKAVAIVAAIYQSNRQGGTPIKLTYPS